MSFAAWHQAASMELVVPHDVFLHMLDSHSPDFFPQNISVSQAVLSLRPLTGLIDIPRPLRYVSDRGEKGFKVLFPSWSG